MTNVAVLSTTRADFGLLKNLLLAIEKDAALHLQLLLAGMHLLPEYGYTCQEVEQSGIPIAATLDLYREEDRTSGLTSRPVMARVVSRGVDQFSAVYQRLESDLLVLLGDRFEILAAAQAALLLDIPCVHIHGGEITEGAVDDTVRHVVSKIAICHFVATESYRLRLMQMGEQPDCVFNVGAPGLEALNELECMSRDQWQEELGFGVPEPALLVTYHPETHARRCPQQQIDELLSALASLNDVFCLFTASNTDAGGEAVLQAIQNFQRQHSERSRYVASLGQRLYLQSLRHVNAVAGNSSSGIIEVPSFGIATINIGDRQRGRERADSVLDVACDREEIKTAIERALQNPPVGGKNPYRKSNSSAIMLEKLKLIDPARGCRKRFFDLPRDWLRDIGSRT